MSELLNHPLIGGRYFFPRPDAVARPTVIDVDGASLRCYAHAPHPGRFTVLHFHGNGEVVADWVPELPRALADRGLNGFFAEYRGYGGSTGVPELTPMLDDALVIADAVADAPERLLVYGRSVGSLFALHVAAQRPVAGLIIESGIADVRERILLRVSADELGVTDDELDAALADTFDHRAKLASFGGPVLVLHARNDHLVAVAHAQQLADWAGDRATLRLFDRGDHNSIHVFNGDALLDEVAAFADRIDSSARGTS